MDAADIVGAGGIGCAVGYALQAAGVSVTFIETNPNKVEAGRRDGVRVDDLTPFGARFVHFDEWTPRTDVPVLLCTKCYDNGTVLAKLPPGMELIPIQNGFDSQLRGFDHHFEGIASFVSECHPDRPHTRITRPGDLHFGASKDRAGRWPRSRLPASDLVSLLGDASLFRVIEVRDINPIKHAKLMYNAAISPLAAAAGIDNGQLLSVPNARQLFFELLQENHRILTAAGIELGRVGPFHPTTVAWILRRKWLAGIMARFFEPSLRGTYCSMAGEIQKGRTEIDNYNGYLLQLAERTETPCPLNRGVYALVKKMTARRTDPHCNVIELLASAFLTPLTIPRRPAASVGRRTAYPSW